MCKRINRDIDAIDPRLRSKIAEVCSGDAGWPLTIIGPAGTGKTCAALCMLDRVVGVQDGPTGGRRYITAADLVRKVNSYRRGEQPQAEESFWDHWQRSKIVTVDEIGAREKVSDAHYEILKMAIDLQQDQPAVFLSNLSIATLAEIYDDRIASRLQFGTVIDLEGWPDRRVMQQNATSSLTSESKP